MAGLLFRVGRFAARRHRLVFAAWAVVLVLVGAAYGLFHGAITSAITIPGTATSNVAEQLATTFPAASGGSGSIVLATTDGAAFTPQQQAQVAAMLGDIDAVDGVKGAVDPFATEAQRAAQAQQLADGKAQIEQARAQLAGLDADQRAPQEQALDAQAAQLDLGAQLLDLASGARLVAPDGSAAVVTVQFDAASMEVAPEVKDAVAAAAATDIPGVDVFVSNEISQETPNPAGVGEIAGVVIAAVVLFVMLGTFVAAGLPLLSALLGVGVATAGSLAFSSLVDFISVTPMLGIMLGLAVGIDYSLFILTRHRRQLRAGMAVDESVGLANGTSGNAVVFAGATVMVALLALNITGIPFLGLMGTVGAGAIFVAILVATTFTPAMLGLVGTRILRRGARTAAPVAAKVPDRPMSTGRAVATLVLGVVALGVVALPATSMRLGLPDGSAEAVSSDQYQAFTTVADRFGPGQNGPLLVVATLPAPVAEEAVLAEQVAVATQVSALDDVVAVAPIGASQDRSVLAFQVVPAQGPTSESTEHLVRSIRDLSATDADGQSVTLGVAGNASANIDVSEKLASALPVYLGVVVGLSLVILILVFRSILVPLTATLGFVLSLFAVLGGLTAIFQWGWLGSVFGVHDPGPILSFLPIITMGILFGLAMDYQLFLVTGMREAYVHGSSPRLAVQRGLHAGRSVVTAAAIIMISVFGGFIFADSATIRPIGFALAFGVLVDAFVVRMLLVPAAMHLLGKSAWWLPRWLDRVLPDVDVEGAQLERTHPVPAPEPMELLTR